jgi:hypothetical protein
MPLEPILSQNVVPEYPSITIHNENPVEMASHGIFNGLYLYTQ